MKKIQYVERDTINEEGEIVLKIKYRPFWRFKIMMLVCILIFLATFSEGYKGGINVYGVINILAFLGFCEGFFMAFSVVDYLMAAMYDDAIILFTGDKVPLAARIPYEDVVEWNINNGTKNTFYLRLKDGTEVWKASYRLDKRVRAAFETFMPGKEGTQPRPRPAGDTAKRKR